MKRMRFIFISLLFAAVAACSPRTVSNPDAKTPAYASGTGPAITVYKSPTCGCCGKWIDHMKEHGFQVTSVDTNELTKIKMEHGVPGKLQSCHTAIVDGYVVEGHVPADVVKKFLQEKPKTTGIAVPGMPIGSPGMEGMYTEAYDILSFSKDGQTTVFASR